MRLFDAIKAADVLRIYRDLVVEIEWYDGAVELSYPGRMGIGSTMFEDQDVTLENGFAQVTDVEGDTVSLEFLKTVPLE